MLDMQPVRLLFKCHQTKATTKVAVRSISAKAKQFYDEDQLSLHKTVRAIVDKDINPYVDQWENEGQYPAHKIFKILGNAGLLGINKPVEYGGQGLNFKYQVAMNEAMGSVDCG